MVMKIENYTGTADAFTFPNNPISYDDSISPNFTTQTIAYQDRHIIVSGGGISPKTIVLTGHFHGSSKNTNFQALTKHFQQSKQLKKLYFETDKFNLGVGKQIKKTQSGGRTNFIDYVAAFQTVIGIMLDNTEQTFTHGGDTKTNSGNVDTYVTEFEGDVKNGDDDVTLTDALGNSYKIPNAVLTTGDTIKVQFIVMADSGSGVYVSIYNYMTINDVESKRIQTTGGTGILKIASGSTVATSITTGGNIDDGYTVKFRNGWSI